MHLPGGGLCHASAHLYANAAPGYSLPVNPVYAYSWRTPFLASIIQHAYAASGDLLPAHLLGAFTRRGSLSRFPISVRPRRLRSPPTGASSWCVALHRTPITPPHIGMLSTLVISYRCIQLMHIPEGIPGMPPPGATTCCFRPPPTYAIAGTFSEMYLWHAPVNEVAFNAFGRLLLVHIVGAFPGRGYLPCLFTSTRLRHLRLSFTGAPSWGISQGSPATSPPSAAPTLFSSVSYRCRIEYICRELPLLHPVNQLT